MPSDPSTWEAHRHCVMCGVDNEQGLGLLFSLGDAGEALSTWHAPPSMQGYTGLLQGGITAALLDAAMANCLHLHGCEAFTAEMNIRYVRPIPVDSHLEVCGQIVERRKQLSRTRAEIRCNGILMASATAKFMTKIC